MAASCGLSSFSANAAGPSPERKSVLVLYSFHEAMPWQRIFREGLAAGLDGAIREERLLLFEEPMDIGRFPEPHQVAIFAAYITQKYAGRKIDLVVAVSEPTSFLLARRSDFFPGVPRLYVSPAKPAVEGLRDAPPGTFLSVQMDVTTALDHTVSLVHPRRVVVVGETTTPLARLSIQDLRKAYPGRKGEVTVDYLLDLRLDDLMRRVKALPSDTIVFLSLMFRDGDGRKLIPFTVARQLAERAPVPVFSHWDSLLGSGIVGGYLMSARRVGELAAHDILTLLSGGTPLDHPRAAFAYLYDWRELQRWGIDEKRLPPEATVLFRPPSFYSLYKGRIIASSAVMAALLALSLGLLLVNRKRKWAIDALQTERQTLELRVAERTRELSDEIAERARLEEQLVLAEKMQAMGRITGGIAHHFNNINTAAIGNLEIAEGLLADAEPSSQTAAQRVDVVGRIRDAKAAVWRAATLTQQLMAFAQQRILRAKPLSVNELVLEKAESLRRDVGSTIIVETRLADDVPAIVADRNVLADVLAELAANAVRAMDGRGTLTLSTQPAEMKTAAANGNGGEGVCPGVAVTVSDTGCGMASDVLEKAVEPFFTTAEVNDRPGLGLSTVHGLVLQSGGQMTVNSIEGQGSSVVLVFPAA